MNMALRLEDKWVWDFWFAQEGKDFHLFYLQANRALENADLRHWNVSIGHAVSHDLRQWNILPDALRPSDAAVEPEAFDTYTTWTGSIIQYNHVWYMFYTGGKRSEKGLVQRVGLATSSDLITWHKHPNNPILEADPRWYEKLHSTQWRDESWRDPFVFRLEDGLYHALICARANQGPSDGRGVIAHAQSANLLDWEVLPPVMTSGDFSQMEVPQVSQIGGRYYLLFCTSKVDFSAARRARINQPTVSGTHYLVADQPLGPYHYLTDEFFVGDTLGSLYAGKLIQDTSGQWQFMAFRNLTEDGRFAGEIIDPLPVSVEQNGKLLLQR
jgi:beta-fructofuranosidase